MAAKRKGKQRQKSSWRSHLLGLLGLGCVVWSALGLSGALEEPPAQHTPAPSEHETTAHQTPAGGQGLSHYPLEVGRYWIYQQTDPQSGAQLEIERRIERREERAGRELFFFSDGSLVYIEAGKVFEIGAQGGVNVIPLEHTPLPYMYQSQGLQIEKWLGAADTSVVVAGRRYPGCLEVVTRLRSPQRRAEISYSSYYAKGIGLVGQEPWPRRPEAVFSVALKDCGHL